MTAKKQSEDAACASGSLETGLSPIPAEVAGAARALGEQPEDLLAWKVYANGEIALILRSGQKFIVPCGGGGQP